MMGMTEQPARAGHVSCSGAGLRALFIGGIQLGPGHPLKQPVSVGSGHRYENRGRARAPREACMPPCLPRSRAWPCTNRSLHIGHCLHGIHVSESVSCLGWSSALFIFVSPAPSKGQRHWRREGHEMEKKEQILGEKGEERVSERTKKVRA